MCFWNEYIKQPQSVLCMWAIANNWCEWRPRILHEEMKTATEASF